MDEAQREEHGGRGERGEQEVLTAAADKCGQPVADRVEQAVITLAPLLELEGRNLEFAFELVRARLPGLSGILEDLFRLWIVGDREQLVDVIERLGRHFGALGVVGYGGTQPLDLAGFRRRLLEFVDQRADELAEFASDIDGGF